MALVGLFLLPPVGPIRAGTPHPVLAERRAGEAWAGASAALRVHSSVCDVEDGITSCGFV